MLAWIIYFHISPLQHGSSNYGGCDQLSLVWLSTVQLSSVKRTKVHYKHEGNPALLGVRLCNVRDGMEVWWPAV